jgi:hypothetical protein
MIDGKWERERKVNLLRHRRGLYTLQDERETRETTKRSVAMRPRDSDALCDEVCNDDEKEHVDASKPRPRPLRPHHGEELGAQTNRQRHRDLARPPTYQNTAPRLEESYSPGDRPRTARPKDRRHDVKGSHRGLERVEDSTFFDRVTQPKGVPAVLQAQLSCHDMMQGTSRSMRELMFRLPPTRILRLVAAWDTFVAVHLPQNATARCDGSINIRTLDDVVSIEAVLHPEAEQLR